MGLTANSRENAMVSNQGPKKVRVRRVVSKFESVVCESPILENAYGESIRSAKSVAGMMMPLLQEEVVEVFTVLLLNGKHRVVGMAEVSRGTLTTALVHPREVFGPALRMSSAAVIVVHNHPSGDPEPSVDDVEVTRRLIEVGRMLGVPLLDHVIVGESGRFTSLRERLEF
ncbi:MAG: DNA repair protein RadC [Planctomycetes bacterium]|nr:DNA repair protein RadC [Planctomycetota bacterium]